jgi:hypothetical protein
MNSESGSMDRAGSRGCYRRPCRVVSIHCGPQRFKERSYQAARSADSYALLAQPALGRLAAALQNDGVALETHGHVVPRGGDEFVFAAQILDLFLEFNLSQISLAQLVTLWAMTYRALLRRLLRRGCQLFP